MPCFRQSFTHALFDPVYKTASASRPPWPILTNLGGNLLGGLPHSVAKNEVVDTVDIAIYSIFMVFSQFLHASDHNT
jgi:hypothetical protein